MKNKEKIINFFGRVCENFIRTKKINGLEFFNSFVPFYDKRPDGLLLIAYWAIPSMLPLC
jgi:hypothetical protein